MDLHSFMCSKGVEPKEAFEVGDLREGRFTRFDVVGRRGKKTGWITLHTTEQGKPLVNFGCWSDDVPSEATHTWTEDGKPLSEEERRFLSAKKKEREARLHDRRLSRRKAVERVLSKLEPENGEHPYLQKKGVSLPSNHGLFRGKNHLVVPMYRDGEVETYQKINVGFKGMARGREALKAVGAYHIVGPDNRTGEIVVAEGLATALSVGEMLEWKVPVAVAFSAHWIDKAIPSLKELGYSRILVAGDNDLPDGRGHRAGQEAAMQAKERHGAVPVIAPEEGKDWNDYHQDHGIEEARKAWSRASTQENTKTGIDLLDWETFQNLPGVSWAIRDLLPIGRTSIFGESGHGKTFAVLDMALSIATGEPYGEFETDETGPVIFIAGEGLNTLKDRVNAWIISRGLEGTAPPFYPTNKGARIPNKDSVKDILMLCDKVKEKHGVYPKGVFIDTLNANFEPGRKENDTNDMSEFTTAMKEIGDYCGGAAVVTTHHSGKADKSTGRGAYSLVASMDVEFRASKKGDTVTLEQTKNRFGELHIPVHFILRNYELGYSDKHGRDVQEAALEFSSSGKGAKVKSLTGHTKTAFEALKVALRECGVSEVHKDAWREKFYKVCTLKGDSKRRSFNRAIEQLTEETYVVLDGEMYRLPGQPKEKGDGGDFSRERDNRDKPGHVPQCPGTTGTHSLRSVPLSRPGALSQEIETEKPRRMHSFNFDFSELEEMEKVPPSEDLPITEKPLPVFPLAKRFSLDYPESIAILSPNNRNYYLERLCRLEKELPPEEARVRAEEDTLRYAGVPA